MKYIINCNNESTLPSTGRLTAAQDAIFERTCGLIKWYFDHVAVFL
jgi:hypothetical protein